MFGESIWLTMVTKDRICVYPQQSSAKPWDATKGEISESSILEKITSKLLL